MGCGTSNSKNAKYKSPSVKPAISSNYNGNNMNAVESRKENISPKNGKNKFGLKLNLVETNGESTNHFDATENWMDDVADCIDEDYSDSDEDDTGNGAWQLTSPLSQKRHLIFFKVCSNVRVG